MSKLMGKELASKPRMALVYFLLVSLASMFVPGLIPGEAGAFLSMGVVLLIIYLVGYYKETGFREIGLIKPNSWRKSIWLGFVYALVIFVVFRITLEPLLEDITGTERDLSKFDHLIGNSSALLSNLIIIWITAAFFEEVFYRGFLITNIASMLKYRKLGWVLGVVISSTIFGLVHGYQGLSGILLTGSAGVFFSLLFLKHRDNLWIPILAHGFTDTSGALMVYFDVYEEVTSVIF